MPRRRVLRPEEADLWQTVARTARPLHPHLPKGPPALAVPFAPPALQPPEPPPLPHFRVGERAATLAPVPTMQPPRAMDSKTHARMIRGKLAPESRIDLHGMTLNEAQPELIRFILNARDQGLRLVLVITGKGRAMHDPVPRPVGALRHHVPHWLRLPPLSPAVQQVSEAHARHGGSGALYVYLRRR